jgi:hypothetical protein
MPFNIKKKQKILFVIKLTKFFSFFVMSPNTKLMGHSQSAPLAINNTTSTYRYCNPAESGYRLIPGVDATNNDNLGRVNDNTNCDVIAHCNNNLSCRGFNSNGWLLHTVEPTVPEPSFRQPNQGLWVNVAREQASMQQQKQMPATIMSQVTSQSASQPPIRGCVNKCLNDAGIANFAGNIGGLDGDNSQSLILILVILLMIVFFVYQNRKNFGRK